ncbi:MAG: NAD(P)-binding protein [Caldithrix sp.]|nr:NAD(P)-binding protein [Caldithrix sp.]
MSYDYDVCVIGSGAGGGPVAYTLAKAGYRVLVLEKGPWFKKDDFFKDEIACCRRPLYTPTLMDERHVIEDQNSDGNWVAESTYDTGRSFWNGNMVGGSSNLMSGYFHRLKPKDFRLLSEFGSMKGANIVDWPIDYETLEPYFTKVEHEVGVSGKVVDYPLLEPRSTEDFPYAPTEEHPVARWFDKACRRLGFNALPAPRAILPEPALGRDGCSYSGYCGSYGCATGAKGSSSAALLNPAVATGHCKVIPHAKVFYLKSDAKGNIEYAEYFDADGYRQKVKARLFVVACQAIESVRLLLFSTGPKHPGGLGNRYGQVGRNLLFSGGGSGSGDFMHNDLTADQVQELQTFGPFFNRALHDWYYIDDEPFEQPVKGGMIEFMFTHPNGIRRASNQKWSSEGLLWGKSLKRQLEEYFMESSHIRFEVFNDWLPNDNCYVELDHNVKDRWGTPVARVRVGNHNHDLKVGRYLADKGEHVLREMGATNVSSAVSGAPPPNLMAGGLRFGNDPRTSVLDKNCRVHDVDNLYVSDGSFMPTGGSVPFTWTIYANAFRVADRIVQHLGG